jgi:endogenous inhibitor of DNA gyrase (YacG/DUF329 family)
MTPAPAKKRPPACPVCRKPLASGQRFCPERCQRVDLGRWLSGDYAIPVEETPLDDDEPTGVGGQG